MGDNVGHFWFGLCPSRQWLPRSLYPSSCCSKSGSYANRTMRLSAKTPNGAFAWPRAASSELPTPVLATSKEALNERNCDRLLCLLALQLINSADTASARFVQGIANTRGIVALTPAQQDPARDLPTASDLSCWQRLSQRRLSRKS